MLTPEAISAFNRGMAIYAEHIRRQTEIMLSVGRLLAAEQHRQAATLHRLLTTPTLSAALRAQARSGR